MPFAHELVGGSFGIRAEYGALLLNQLSQGFAIGGQTLYTVSFLLHAH